MGIKHLGGVLVLLAVAVELLRRRRRMQGLCDRLSQWIALFRYIRGQIACFGCPIAEILAHADASLCAQLCLVGAQGSDLTLLLRRDATYIGGEAGALLMRLSEEFGGLWREEQLVQLDELLAALERAYATRLQKEREQWKLRAVLSLCGTLGVLLLLW